MELSLLLGAISTLWSVISEINDRYQEKRNNDRFVTGDLQEFLDQLKRNEELIRGQVRHALRNSNGTTCNRASDNLQQVLERSEREAQKILKKGFVRSVWDSNRIRCAIQALRERVMTAFQIYLTIATLNVTLESKREQEEYERAMADANRALWARYERTISMTTAATQKEIMEVRQDLKLVKALLVKKMEQEERRIVAEELRNMKAQTSEAEKFLADILAALESPPPWSSEAAAGSGGTHGQAQEQAVDAVAISYRHSKSPSSRNPSVIQVPSIHTISLDRDGSTSAFAISASDDLDLRWYHDPITYEKMCDPVKATDGHTYDRWTIIKNPSGMARSPFRWDAAAGAEEENKGETGERVFQIAANDLDVRSRLFLKFPEQEEKFRQEREKYRREALAAATSITEEVWGDDGDDKERKEALRMLDFVLQWDNKDAECRAARRRLLGGHADKDAATAEIRRKFIRSDAAASADTNTYEFEQTNGGGLTNVNDYYAVTNSKSAAGIDALVHNNVEEGEAFDGIFFLQFPHARRPPRAMKGQSSADLYFLAFPRLL